MRTISIIIITPNKLHANLTPMVSLMKSFNPDSKQPASRKASGDGVLAYLEGEFDHTSPTPE